MSHLKRDTTPSQKQKLSEWIDQYPMSTRLRNGLRKISNYYQIESADQIDELMFIRTQGLGEKSWKEFLSLNSKPRTVNLETPAYGGT